jgi:hypothetical protein
MMEKFELKISNLSEERTLLDTQMREKEAEIEEMVFN